MKIKPILDSIAKFIIKPCSPEFSTRKKVAAWAVSILLFLPLAGSLHIFSFFWNQHRVKHTPEAAPQVTQVFQAHVPPSPVKQEPLPQAPIVQPEPPANPLPEPIPAPIPNAAPVTPPPVSPSLAAPSVKMIDMSALKNEATALKIIEDAGEADTYFFFDSMVIAEDWQKAFEDYRLKSKDPHLSRKGAYLLVPRGDRFDHTVYYHYLIKALQDKGLDVYFVVLAHVITGSLADARHFSSAIEVEGNRDDVWHPYFIKFVNDPRTNWVMGDIYPQLLKPMDKNFAPNQAFAKIPKILGWSIHTITF